MFSAKDAKQTAMAANDDINNVYMLIEGKIKNMAKKGYFSARAYWEDYNIPSCSVSLKRSVKNYFESLGYGVYDLNDSYIEFDWI